MTTSTLTTENLATSTTFIEGSPTTPIAQPNMQGNTPSVKDNALEADSNPDYEELLKAMDSRISTFQEALQETLKNLQGDIISEVYKKGVEDAAPSKEEVVAQTQNYELTEQLTKEVENLKAQLVQTQLKEEINKSAIENGLHPEFLNAYLRANYDIDASPDGFYIKGKAGRKVSIGDYVKDFASSETGAQIRVPTTPPATGASDTGSVTSEPITYSKLINRVFPSVAQG